MNAAAAARLEDILRGANPVRVATVRIDHYPMTASLVKQRFEAAKNVEINDHGMGAEQADGSWLWVESDVRARPQPRPTAMERRQHECSD